MYIPKVLFALIEITGQKMENGLLSLKLTCRKNAVTLKPQGHHASGKKLILFMIIYMMVRLGLVL